MQGLPLCGLDLICLMAVIQELCLPIVPELDNFTGDP